MANLNFKGDLNGVNELQLEYVRNVLEELGYKENDEVLLESVGKTGDNHMATMKRIIVDKNGATFKMVAKVALADDSHRESANTGTLFQNEHYMYTEVLPKFDNLLKSAGIPEEERLRTAICYGSLNEPPNEIILLEDLQLSDYAILDRFKALNNETVKLVLKNFAIFHSLSFVLKHQEPETFEDFTTKINDPWKYAKTTEGLGLYIESFEDRIISMLDSDEHKEKVKGTLSRLYNHTQSNADIDEKSEYACMLHGDGWTNNFMFRLEGNKPVNCCFVDFQISKKCSPVLDLQYMIFNCTDYETRSKHYHDWIDYYHSEFDKNLGNFGLKAKVIYPRDQLDADLKRYGKASLSLSLFLSSIMLQESSETEKKDDVGSQTIEEKMKAIFEDSISSSYKSRVAGLLDSCIELGYI